MIPLPRTDCLELPRRWHCARWPFGDDAPLRGGDPGAFPQTIDQPGKVFYADAQKSPDTIAGFHKRFLSHLHTDDGAWLFCEVPVPTGWTGKRVFLHFEGVYPAADLYVNGTPLCEHRDGLLPLQAEVTAQATPGRPLRVALRLWRRHGTVEMDMPRHSLEFAGLSAEAFLFAVEPLHVSAFHLPALLGEDGCTGTLGGTVELAPADNSPTEAQVRLALYDGTADAPFAETSATATPTAGESLPLSLQLTAAQITPWSAENPRLYRAVLTLECGGARTQWEWRCGFTRVELKDERALFNGLSLKVRGVTWMSFDPEGGLYQREEWLRANLRWMKRANVNAIHTHFTPPPLFNHLCDELGFHLLQDITLDWSSHLLDKPDEMPRLLRRVETTVRRDRHHPALLCWTIGNENLSPGPEGAETFWANLQALDARCGELDPHHPTAFPPPGPTNQVRDLMITRAGRIGDLHYSFRPVRSLRETGTMTQASSWQGPFEEVSHAEARAHGWSGVWMSSEWGLTNHWPELLEASYNSLLADTGEAAPGNAFAAMAERLRAEWTLMRDDPSCLGGTFFAWLAVGTGDPWGFTMWAEDADWGLLTHDLAPKPAFWILRKLYEPVRLPEMVSWQPGTDTLRLPLRNDFHTTDLAACTVRVQTGPGGAFRGLMRGWRDIALACAPGAEAVLEVPLFNPVSREALAAGETVLCRIQILDPSGLRVVTHDCRVEPATSGSGKGGRVVIGPDAKEGEV